MGGGLRLTEHKAGGDILIIACTAGMFVSVINCLSLSRYGTMIAVGRGVALARVMLGGAGSNSVA